MPDFSCQLNDIGTATDCSDNPGLLVVYATLDADVNWTDMALPANYDDATYTILNWVMTGANQWAKFSFERKNGQLTSTYTIDNGYYEVQLLNLLFKGKTSARTISLGQLVSCCGLILQVHDNNSIARVIGKEYQSGGWVDPLERGRVIRHLDTTGAFGDADDRARDEVDFGAEHSNPLPYSSVDVATMDTLI